jgi:hypothetical protein
MLDQSSAIGLHATTLCTLNPDTHKNDMFARATCTLGRTQLSYVLWEKLSLDPESGSSSLHLLEHVATLGSHSTAHLEGQRVEVGGLKDMTTYLVTLRRLNHFSLKTVVCTQPLDFQGNPLASGLRWLQLCRFLSPAHSFSLAYERLYVKGPRSPPRWSTNLF